MEKLKKTPCLFYNLVWSRNGVFKDAAVCNTTGNKIHETQTRSRLALNRLDQSSVLDFVPKMPNSSPFRLNDFQTWSISTSCV